MFPLSLDQQQYESLVALARAGATTEEKSRQLEQFLRSVEKANGITRDFVLVRWQELDQPLPIGTFFPTSWPPQLQRTIEMVTRPIARADVERMLDVHATNPTSVMCTRDPAGVLGFKTLDQFFIT
jgi:hypothetical protein